MADEKAAGRRSEPDDEGPVFTGGVPIAEIRRMVDSGRTYRVDDPEIVCQFDAFAEFEPLLPEGSRFAAWVSVGPPVTPGAGRFTIRTAGGGELSFDADLGAVLGSRGLYFPEFELVIPSHIGGNSVTGSAFRSMIYHEVVHAAWPRLTDADLLVPFSVLGMNDVGNEVASGIYHELAHAAWTRLGPVERARLAVHEADPRDFDMRFRKF